MTPRLPVPLQWMLTLAFLAWSCILAVVIMGDDSPESPLSLFDFFIIKAMAIGSAYSTYKAANWCYVRDLFPKLVYAYIEQCKKEEDEL